MNPRTRRLFFAFLLLAGAAWIALTATTRRGDVSQTAAAPQEGFFAPDFSLQTMTGETLSLSEFRGKVVLVNFWATWCPPCREEMPALQSVYEKYRGEGFVVLAVNLTVSDSASDLREFVEGHALAFPVLLDETGDVGTAYQVRSLPTSFFIGKDGVIRSIVVGGPMSHALLETEIESLLEETP